MDMELEEQVRHLAYAIWESEGRPDGHAQEHWDQALKKLGSVVSAPAASMQAAAPAKKSSRRPMAKAQAAKSKRQGVRAPEVTLN